MSLLACIIIHHIRLLPAVELYYFIARRW